MGKEYDFHGEIVHPKNVTIINIKKNVSTFV